MTATSTIRLDRVPKLTLRECRYCKKKEFEVDGWFQDDVCVHCECQHLQSRLGTIEDDLHELERIEIHGGRLDRYQTNRLNQLTLEQKQLIQRIDHLQGVTYGN